VDSRRQPPFHVDGEGFGFALQQALRGEHMADFGAADAEGEGANAPWVLVWLSPHTMVIPAGWRRAPG